MPWIWKGVDTEGIGGSVGKYANTVLVWNLQKTNKIIKILKWDELCQLQTVEGR